MKRPLQAILIAGPEQRDSVLNGTKKITIREGHRDYILGQVLIGCHILNWATMKNITKVTHKYLFEVNEDEYKADGFANWVDLVEGLQKYYPTLTALSPITVIEWE